MKNRTEIGRLLRSCAAICFLAFLWIVSGRNSDSGGVVEAGSTEDILEQQWGAIGAIPLSTETEMKSALIVDTGENELKGLQKDLEEMIADAEGVWGIYVKNLSTEHAISINPQEMYAASLIKLFVMESSAAYIDELIEMDCAYSGDMDVSKSRIAETLEAMITVSDNEAYNEMVRLHSGQRSFTEGCECIEEYIERNEYAHTEIYSTLWPSATTFETRDINGENHTSVIDCASLLEDIYRGNCVSEKASKEMLKLLLGQQVVHKIPAGIPDGVKVANKTGETDDVQHDAAIVFGPKTDYIICVMSSELTDIESATELIQNISERVYKELEL